jgi:hypothetical protein
MPMTTLLMRRETRIRALAAVRGALASDARRATSARAGGGDRATTTSAAVGHAMRNFQRLLTSASASSSSAVSASSQTVDRIDSFKLVKNLTASGLPEAQAHAVVATCLDAMTRAGFVVRSDLERELMQARAEVQALKVETNSQLRETAAASRHQTETLVAENDKLRADMKYNIERITQSQKLDLNLEKGRMREEYAKLESTSNATEARVDRELSAMKTQMEAAKTEIIRGGIGALVSFAALGLAALRVFM